MFLTKASHLVGGHQLWSGLERDGLRQASIASDTPHVNSQPIPDRSSSGSPRTVPSFVHHGRGGKYATGAKNSKMCAGNNITTGTWNYDSTLLHEAVSLSNVELVSMLIRAGADVNSINQDGRTALHLACRGGNVDIVRALIAAGTNTNKRTVDGKTCLQVAVWRGHEEIVVLLVEAGADVNIPDSDGCSPLYWAARSNYLSIMEMLIDAGAKVNFRVKSKWTPLHMALHLGHMDVVNCLLLHGAETNIVVDSKSVVCLLIHNKHLTHQARLEALEMFIQAGYNIHKDSWTPASTILSPSSPSAALSSSVVKTTNVLIDDDLMVQWLEKKKEQLPRLTYLCRTRIRKRLIYCNKGKSIVNIVLKLPVPSILKNFVGFKGDGIIDKDSVKCKGDDKQLEGQ